MNKLLSLTAWIGLLVSTGSVANAQNRIEFKEFKLDNGLTVLMHRDNTTPIVAVSVMYHVGSKNERPDRTGFAHFFEHLLFEGTENIGRGEYMKKIESIGGTLNAFTSNDVTYYYEVVPSNYLETALYMESERMLHAKIDSTGIATQRSVIKEEKKQSYDNRPYGTILQETFKRTHQVHPYNWTVIGSTEHLDAATLDEFMQFYRTYYVPNNAVLSIAGDIDYAQTEAWIRTYFSEIPKGTGTINRPNVTEPKRTQEIRDVVYDNIQLPAVIQAYNLPPKKHKDSPALAMLSTYLTGGKSSLLTKEVVDKQQKAVVIQAFPLDLEDGGLFLMFGVANMGIAADSLEHAIDEQVNNVIANGISEADFQKLKAQIENSVVSRHASVAGIAQSLAEAKTFYGDADEVNRAMDKYNEVTRQDIQRVAKQYLGKDGRVVLYYLPKSEEPKQ
ncbi:Predicted Zn-dependent peptidase [Parapedobacter composti]|uniref:Predicted Zn-dependent peptidase n=1 Tax=Parapedobacter composti TaxID=623281 RepID=A0A1I1F4K5_9SPHI|nr:pitrilysin family protein [Parapedobacter composti]SFB93872.1 Predicted Zn-dependent peptidase [Parapedobacter composti]